MPKKIPLRMCVVCRSMLPKSELLRVVKNDDGISVDITGKKAGRGAYICKNPACAAKCVSKKLFNRVFDCAIDDEVYLNLKEELDAASQN